MSIGGDKELAEFAFGDRPCRPVREHLKEVIFHSADLHRYFTWTLITANFMKPRPQKLKQVEKAIVSGEESITKYLDKKLIVLPVWHSAAPKHGQVSKEIFSLSLSLLRVLPFVCLANTWGLPALVVPVAEDKQGMPIGLQVIGRVGNEDAIFQLGEILEKNMRGYRRASII